MTNIGSSNYSPGPAPFEAWSADVTYFASALIESLDGAAAFNRNGQWVVDTFSLGHAVGQIVSSIATDLNKPLTCNPDPSGLPSIIHYPVAAHVKTCIRCQTVQAASESVSRVASQFGQHEI